MRAWGIACDAWDVPQADLAARSIEAAQPASPAAARLSEAIAEELTRLLRDCNSNQHAAGNERLHVTVRPLQYEKDRSAALLHQPHSHAHDSEHRDGTSSDVAAALHGSDHAKPMVGVPILPWRQVAPLLDEPRHGCPLVMHVSIPSDSYSASQPSSGSALAVAGTCASLADGSIMHEVLGRRGLVATRLGLRFSEPLVTVSQHLASHASLGVGEPKAALEAATLVGESADAVHYERHDHQKTPVLLPDAARDGASAATGSFDSAAHATQKPQVNFNGAAAHQDRELTAGPRLSAPFETPIENAADVEVHAGSSSDGSKLHLTAEPVGEGWSVLSTSVAVGLVCPVVVAILILIARFQPLCFRAKTRRAGMAAARGKWTVTTTADAGSAGGLVTAGMSAIMQKLSPSSAAAKAAATGHGRDRAMSGAASASAAAIGCNDDSDDESRTATNGGGVHRSPAAAAAHQTDRTTAWASGVYSGAGAAAMPYDASSAVGSVRRRGHGIPAAIGTLSLPPVYPLGPSPAMMPTASSFPPGPTVTAAHFPSGAMGTPYPSPVAAAAAAASPLSGGPFAYVHTATAASANTISSISSSASASAKSAVASPMARSFAASPHAAAAAAAGSYGHQSVAWAASPLAAARFHSPTSSLSYQAAPGAIMTPQLLPSGPTLVLQSGAALAAQPAKHSPALSAMQQQLSPSRSVGLDDLEAGATDNADGEASTAGLPSAPKSAGSASTAASWSSLLRLPRAAAPAPAHAPQAMAPRLPGGSGAVPTVPTAAEDLA